MWCISQRECGGGGGGGVSEFLKANVGGNFAMDTGFNWEPVKLLQKGCNTAWFVSFFRRTSLAALL